MSKNHRYRLGYYKLCRCHRGGQPKIIENIGRCSDDSSIVSVAKNGDRLVGLLAKRQAVTNPENTVWYRNAWPQL
jgi:molecular chaperone DnaK (HSP70)